MRIINAPSDIADIDFVCPVRAEAEPMSVRCDGSYFLERQPYFMTEVEKRHFLVERAGGNIITGEIISAMTSYSTLPEGHREGDTPRV